MARIMKIRAVPRGYVKTDELKSVFTDRAVTEWFMALYNKFGKPQNDGVWSYMLRHNCIVVKIKATDEKTVDYDVWVSPGVVFNAKRKRSKAINIIARRLNEDGVAFVAENVPQMYYTVRVKNAKLLEKSELSDAELQEAMNKALTDNERTALYGDMSQYMQDAIEEIQNTEKEIFNEN